MKSSQSLFSCRRMRELARTTEDSRELYNAGQFKTFLNVSGKDNVKSAIVEFIDSLNDSTDLSYTAYFNRQKDAKMLEKGGKDITGLFKQLYFQI